MNNEELRENFIHWYLGSFVLICILLLVVLYFNDLSIDEIKSVFPDALFQLIEHWFFWVILLVPYLFFLLIRFLLKNEKTGDSGLRVIDGSFYIMPGWLW